MSDETRQSFPDSVREMAERAAAGALAEYVGEPAFAPSGEPMYGPHARVMVAAVLAVVEEEIGRPVIETRLSPSHPLRSEQRVAYVGPWVSVEGAATE